MAMLKQQNVASDTSTSTRFATFFTKTTDQRNFIFAVNDGDDDDQADSAALLYEHEKKYPIIQVFKDKKLEHRFLTKLFYSNNYRRFIISDLIVCAFMIGFVFADVFNTEVQWLYFTILALRLLCFPFFIASIICKCLPCTRRSIIFIELVTSFTILVGIMFLNVLTALRYQRYVERSLSGFPDGSTMVLICGSIIYRYVHICACLYHEAV